VVAPPITAEVPTTTESSVNDRQFDLSFWNSIKSSDDPAMYEAYLVQFPDGTFASLANLILSTLRANDAERLAAEEEVQRQVQRLAAEEEAQRQVQRLAAEEEVRRQVEAERLAAEEEARRQVQRLAAEEEVQRQVQRLAAEEEARRQAETDRLAAEEAQRRAAEEEVIHLAAISQQDDLGLTTNEGELPPPIIKLALLSFPKIGEKLQGIEVEDAFVRFHNETFGGLWEFTAISRIVVTGAAENSVDLEVRARMVRKNSWYARPITYRFEVHLEKTGSSYNFVSITKL
jgi:flagellar biosynthesis GTPase FlhF